MSIKNLRYFVRLDARMKPVLGSLIARKHRPMGTAGSFFEIFPPTCCGSTGTLFTATQSGSNTGSNPVTVTIGCGGAAISELSVTGYSVAQLMTYLNDELPGVGTWSLTEDETTLTVDSSLCDDLTVNVVWGTATTVTATVVGTPSLSSTVQMVATCGVKTFPTYGICGGTSSSSLADTVSKLNTDASAFGTWVLTGSVITVTNPICEDLVATITYYEP